MKKYRFLKDFLGMSKSYIICEFENNDIIKALLNDNIIEEVKPKPKNRFLLKAEDMKYGLDYWFIDSCNEIFGSVWQNVETDYLRLANNNVFLDESECDAQVKRNKATAKCLKCFAKYNEARGFAAFKDKSEYINAVFAFRQDTQKVYTEKQTVLQYSRYEYYFHEDDAESIREELGDECLMLVFGGE